MRAFTNDVTASDVLKGCEALGLKASEVRVREAPHPLDDAGTRGFMVMASGGRKMKVRVLSEDQDACFC